MRDGIMMLVDAAHLIGCILNEQRIDTEVAARWSQVAVLRAR